MSPWNVTTAAVLTVSVWAATVNFAVCGAEEPSGQSDHPVQWHLSLKGTKA